ncbi:hypothetical protein C0068_14535 [Zhongshania marina]|uniref:Oligosaccharide repeat unit polymerase n=2 Tax=Zhongshania marina TaxID=2304603 RepID=A0A2S4HDZ7_9GAMM|nr:hypothetical protein C0068_14535 [Marortus luteolus]
MIFFPITTLFNTISLTGIFLALALIATGGLAAVLIFSMASLNVVRAGYRFSCCLYKVERRLRWLTFLFVILALVEFLYAGYVPLLSMALGRSISHFAFGIPSLHGMVLSLGATLATGWFFVYLAGERQKFKLAAVVMILIVFALFVSRKMIMVTIFQALLMLLMFDRTVKTKLVVIGCGVIGVLLFGVIGDIRTGRNVIIGLSRLKVEYPEFLPTGLLWFYIYVTTPLANLVNAMQLSLPATYSFSFLGGLLPTDSIREFFFPGANYSGELAFDNYYQISDSFNVGTGFVKFYESFGAVGVFLSSSVFYGVTVFFLNFTRSVAGFLSFIVCFQCLSFLIFANNFLNLNTIFQIFFLYFIVGGVRFGGTGAS